MLFGIFFMFVYIVGLGKFLGIEIAKSYKKSNMSKRLVFGNLVPLNCTYFTLQYPNFSLILVRATPKQGKISPLRHLCPPPTRGQRASEEEASRQIM